jgi:hypothetical protein
MLDATLVFLQHWVIFTSPGIDTVSLSQMEIPTPDNHDTRSFPQDLASTLRFPGTEIRRKPVSDNRNEKAQGLRPENEPLVTKTGAISGWPIQPCSLQKTGWDWWSCVIVDAFMILCPLPFLVLAITLASQNGKPTNNSEHLDAFQNAIKIVSLTQPYYGGRQS